MFIRTIIKLFLYLFIIQAVLESCNTARKSKADYLKVVVVGNSDSITEFNKGISVHYYAYFDLKTDSVICRTVKAITPVYQFENLTGRIKKLNQNDTIKQLIIALKKYPTGIMQSTFDSRIGSTDAFDGLEFYIEFKEDGKRYFYYYLQGDLDEDIRNFEHYFFNLDKHNEWVKKSIPDNLFDADSIAVATAKQLGLYDKREIPKKK